MGSVKMAKRITTYLDNYTMKNLNHYDNKSEVVKKALHMYFNDKEHYLYQKKEIENRIHDYEFKITQEKIKLDYVEREIERIDKINKRPELYEKAVETLIIMDDVTDYDIAFQAERLKVTVSQLKRWLYDDGYYERIFSPEPVEKRYSYL